MVKRKIGATPLTPIILLGQKSYWRKKITSSFQINLNIGTIKGSEWISNCMYCIQKAEEGAKIYKSFFEKKLKIGKNGPIYKDGFCS